MVHFSGALLSVHTPHAHSRAQTRGAGAAGAERGAASDAAANARASYSTVRTDTASSVQTQAQVAGASQPNAIFSWNVVCRNGLYEFSNVPQVSFCCLSVVRRERTHRHQTLFVFEDQWTGGSSLPSRREPHIHAPAIAAIGLENRSPFNRLYRSPVRSEIRRS